MNKTLKKAIVITVIIIAVITATLGTVITNNHKNSTKIAEQKLAIHFAKQNTKFLSLEEVYAYTEREGFICYIDLSGSANCYHTATKQYLYPFKATVKINLITNECEIVSAYISKP